MCCIHFHFEFTAIISEFLMALCDTLAVCRQFTVLLRHTELWKHAALCSNPDILYFNKGIFELTACCQIKTEICAVSVGTNGTEL